MILKTVIIGKNSNLSNYLTQNIKNSVSFSSRELLTNESILEKYKYQKINLVFNNFQPATKLNILENTEFYINNSILITAKVLDCFKNTEINKIIYASSSSVYGNNILCNENDELKPMNLHASLKVANKNYINLFEFLVVYVFSFLKYLRRVVKVKF